MKKIDKLVHFCNNDLENNTCTACNHIKECPGNCNECINQIHLKRDEHGRKDYNCPYIVEYYVCKYIYAYATEIEKCLIILQEDIINLGHIHMLSIGSGASPDLYALWNFCEDICYTKPISYIGYEHNENWKRINKETERIFNNSNVAIEYRYEDIFEEVKNKKIENANILILQYILSHIVYNGREDEVISFFNHLVENVILKMERNAFIIINDINHNLARDKFKILENVIKNHNKNIKVHKYYYPYKSDLNDFQREGEMHQMNNIYYEIDNHIKEKYDTRNTCRSIQHIIEVIS